MLGLGGKLTALCVCLLSALPTILGLEQGAVRVSVGEGRDVILPCSLVGTNIESKLFDWKKVGQTVEGKKEIFLYDGHDEYNNGRDGQDPQFKGRVSHFQHELKHGNASILITNTKVADSGDYTCDFLEPSQSLEPFQTSHIKLLVFSAALRPYIKILNATAGVALLQCEVFGAFPIPKLQWQDSEGNILYAEEPQYTLSGGKYDVTVLINVTKTDHYSCVATQEEIHHPIFAETFVYIHGAAPEPYIKTLDQTKEGYVLQCEVLGASPEPKVQWKDSDGNNLTAGEPQVTERGGSYNVTVLINVAKTDRYRCVATQEEIHHQTEAETFVFIDDKVPEDPSSKVAEDPSNIDPSNTDPSNIDPSNTDPSNTDPSNTDPSNIDPSNIDPSNTDPSNTDPSNTDPSNIDPSNTDPSNTDPSNTDPSNIDPSNTDPSNTDPSNTDPSNIDPSNTDPSNTDPSNIDPSNTDPSNTDPSNTDPSNTDPSNTDPSNTDPSNTDPSNTDPSNTDPSNTDPSNTDPSNIDPSNTDPSNIDPSNIDPSNIDPSNIDPSNTDPSSKVATGWSVGFLLGALSLAVVQLVLLLTKVISINFNKGCSWWNSPDEGTPDEKGTLSPSEQNGTKETAVMV